MRIGIVGCFQNGKSTIINCLLGAKFAQTGGEGISVTSANISYSYYPYNCILSINGFNNNILYSLKDVESGRIKGAKEITIGCNSPILKYITLVDTPGFNANSKDTQVAFDALNNIDIAILVVNNCGLSSIEMDILKEIQLRKLPFYVIMNCVWERGTHISTWDPQSEFNQTKMAELLAKIKTSHFSPMLINNQPIIVLNAIWYWYAISHFQFELSGKREDLMDDIDRYKTKITHVDFLRDSNFMSFQDFFSSPINLLPVNVYLTFRHNLSMTVDSISEQMDKYSQNIQNITIHEVKMIASQILSLQKEIDAKNKNLNRLQVENKECHSKSISERFNVPYMRLLNGDILGGVREFGKILTSNAERYAKINPIENEQNYLMMIINQQEKMLNLFKTMLNNQIFKT